MGLLAGVVSGAVLFFLCFAAIFNGLLGLLIAFLLGFAVAAALLGRSFRLTPRQAASALAAPAVPWVLWLWPASIPEAGLLRASLWPALLVAVFGLAYLGAAAARHTRAGQRRRVR